MGKRPPEGEGIGKGKREFPFPLTLLGAPGKNQQPQFGFNKAQFNGRC